jgi:drug/metabolite transporter (DMT)-like permease
MSLTVFVAVIGAALLHASWNALIKGGADKRVAMGAVMLGHLPLALIGVAVAPLPSVASLPYLLVGIGLHFGYQLFLMQSYRIGDLTQVYPIARGSAPLIVALISVLFLGVQLAPMELLGVTLIGAGVLSLALVRRADGMRNSRAAGMALTTGCFIAAYSLVDGLGARLAGTSLGFFSWLAIGNGVLIVLYLSLTAPSAFRDIAVRGRRTFVVGGSASFIAYALVTWAFTQAPIALVTALREVSIIFALLIGVVFLKERLDLAKVFATMTTLLGVVLLRFAKTG